MTNAPKPGPDGWTPYDPDALRLVLGHEPPRPGAFWVQLREDARSWHTVCFWAFGTLLGVVGGAVAGYGFATWSFELASWSLLWGPLGVGLAAGSIRLLSTLLRFFREAVRRLRDGVAVTAEVRELQPHALDREWAVTSARLADGRLLPVALPRSLVDPLLRP